MENNLILKYVLIRQKPIENNVTYNNETRTYNISLDIPLTLESMSSSNIKTFDNYLEINGVSEKIHYEIGETRENTSFKAFGELSYYRVYTFSIKSKISQDDKAQILSNLNKMLNEAKGENYLVVLYDNISLYYSNKIIEEVLDFESKLREIITLELIRCGDWDEKIKEVLENKKKHNIEQVLKESTLAEINKLFLSLFSYPDKEFLEKHLDEIREFRNQMFHIKGFFYEDYIALKNVFKEIKPEIIKIKNTAVKDKANKEIFDTVEGLKGLPRMVENLRKQMLNNLVD